MKKTNLIVCIVLVATMLLTACGGGGGGGGAKVNLVYWSMWNKTEPSAVALTTIIQKFEAKYPNVTITAVWNGRENQTKVRTALGANTTIDIVDQDGDQIAGGLMQEGLLLPLDDMYNSTALDESTTFKDVFNPGVVDFYMKDGKHYLMPMDAAPVMFWYNKDAFTKAGIAQVPATWDEFLTDLQKLKDAGYVPLAIEGDGGDYNGWYIEYIVERLKGPGFLIKSLEDKTGDSWKDPVYTQAFTMVKAGIQRLSVAGCPADPCPRESRDGTVRWLAAHRARPDHRSQFQLGWFQLPGHIRWSGQGDRPVRVVGDHGDPQRHQTSSGGYGVPEVCHDQGVRGDVLCAAAWEYS